MIYDKKSPLSEPAQDSLIHAQMRPGGLPGVASEGILAELRAAGYLTGNGYLTKAGATEGKRLWTFYWGQPWEPGR